MDDIIRAALGNGLNALQEYMSAHVLACLVPAFFIAGAIATFVSKGVVLKYFGMQTKKYVSYSVASVSGTILAVCSCTILPLFAGIYKKGAGIGPATAFLFSGPAINLLAIVYTASVLGYDIGLARAVSAILMSVVIGLVMAFVFKEKGEEKEALIMDSEKTERKWYVSLLFFVILIAILLVAAGQIPLITKFIVVYLLTVALSIILIFYYSREETKNWGRETGFLSKKLIPILLIGVFITGVISYFIPYGAIKPWLGGNSISACFIASLIGAILYMPTLLEVPIVGSIFGYQHGVIGQGPALALLLAGPSLSLPNMLVISRIMGVKKTSVYISLVVIISTIIGVIYGGMIG